MLFTKPQDFVIVSLYNGIDNPTPYYFTGGDALWSKERSKAARYFERDDAKVMLEVIEAECAYGARIEIWTLEPEHA